MLLRGGAVTYREAAVPGVDADMRPVGALEKCPCCGQKSGEDYSKVFFSGFGPGDARACSGGLFCSEKSLHMHQKCRSCGHKWTCLPVGAKS